MQNGVMRAMPSILRAAVRAPVSRRAGREALFCLTVLPFCLANPAVVFFLVTMLLFWATPNRPPNPAWWDVLAGLLAAGLTLMVLVAGAARPLGAASRRLAARLLGEQIAAPPPRPGRGRAGRLAAGLRDGASWRAAAYQLVKLPVGMFESYVVVVFWVFGLVNLSYPFWWLSFRNHPAGTHLQSVPVFTPLGWFGHGTFRVGALPGTFAASAAGLGMLLAAPWVTRAVVAVDSWLMRRLLGPGGLAQRVRDLEQSRAVAVDDAATRLRRLERDLHDGAQIRLATLALNLGMARKKLGADGEVLDPSAVRKLVDAALLGAKAALGELRELARGIHPPVLDNGLADALATLAASNAIPAQLTISLPVRPTPAIESIAYFCAAELLANAAKHSNASDIKIDASGRDGVLVLHITDDGAGGADPARGSGLAGLRQRVAVVDGHLDISSPPGGPTRVTIELPLHT